MIMDNLAMVTEMVVIAGIGAYAGRWLDARFGTDPVLLYSLSFAAFFAGMYRLIKASSRPSPPE